MSRFSQQRVLIVGGAGFVGSNLCHQLLAENVKEVIVIDNLLSADISNVPLDDRVTFIPKSITDNAALENLSDNIDYIFHLSTYHGNQSSIHDPIADHENNTYTTLKLLEKIKDFKSLKKVVYSSAGCTVAEKTFDSAEATTEDSPISPYLDSPYQISKIVGEFYGNFYWKQHGTPFVKARFQNVYGPREILGAGDWRGTSATVWRNVIPTFVWKSLNSEALPLDRGGIATRDFIFASDIVEGLICCALNGEGGGVYNLASGVETSILELAETINSITGNATPLDIKPARDWDNSGKRFGDISQAENTINFKAKIDLRSGLEQTIKWTKQNESLIRSRMLQHVKFLPDLVTFEKNEAA